MFRIWMLAGWLVLAGCSSSDSETAISSKVGTNGSMEFAVAPEKAPTQGKNAFQVSVADAKTRGAMVGCMMTVAATMPAMGDGSEGAVVKDVGAGKYDVTNVTFTMGGAWRLTFRCEMGDMKDEAAFDYDVP